MRTAFLFATTCVMAIGLAPSVAAAQQTDQATAPQTTTAAPEEATGDIIVTARRESENLLRVPVAVSVLTDKQFSTMGTFRPEDISLTVPGLTVAGGGDSDRSNIVFTIRGQGNVYGTLFPSVITYFNDVPTKSVGVGQFFDLTSLQVLRGPQGTQFGRVTNGGNVMLTARRPTDEFEAEVTGKAGSLGLVGTQGFMNVPLSDTLMVRAAWDLAHRDGFTKNVNDGRRFDDVNYQSFRGSILFRPNDRFENLTVVQHQRVNDHGTPPIYTYQNSDAAALAVGSLFPLVTVPSEFGLLAPIYGIDNTNHVVAYQPGMTPLTGASYVAALQAEVAKQQALGPRQTRLTIPMFNKRKITYVTNTTTADLTDNLTLTNVFGYTRFIERSAQNYTGDDIGFVAPCHSGCTFNNSDVPFIDQEQFSEELRLSGKALDNRLNWSLGVYADEQRPGGPVENDTVLFSILERNVLQQTKTTSRAVYGNAEFEVADGLKLTGGARYTHDTVNSNIANYIKFIDVPGLEQTLATTLAFDPTLGPFANAIAAATVNAQVPHGVCTDYGTGGIFQTTCANVRASFNAFTWTIGASYQINPDQLVYGKVSRGYRPGGVNPVLSRYTPEQNTSFEVGLKGKWDVGSMQLRTSIAAYHDKYTKIQQSVSFINATTGAAESAVANVAKARINGIEVETSLIPIDGMNIGANYAYTDAKFDRSNFNPLACDATQTVLIGFCPLNRFVNTPKHQLGINFHYDFIRNSDAGTFGFGGQFNHQSSVALANSANSFVSPRGIERAYSTVNLNANWNQIMGHDLDMTVFVTNVTNKLYRVIANSNNNLSSIGNESAVYAPPRMYGVSLTARFR